MGASRSAARLRTATRFTWVDDEFLVERDVVPYASSRSGAQAEQRLPAIDI